MASHAFFHFGAVVWSKNRRPKIGEMGPRPSEAKRLEICKPAASSFALLILLPEDNRSKLPAKLLVELAN